MLGCVFVWPLSGCFARHGTCTFNNQHHRSLFKNLTIKSIFKHFQLQLFLWTWGHGPQPFEDVSALAWPLAIPFFSRRQKSARRSSATNVVSLQPLRSQSTQQSTTKSKSWECPEISENLLEWVTVTFLQCFFHSHCRARCFNGKRFPLMAWSPTCDGRSGVGIH